MSQSTPEKSNAIPAEVRTAFFKILEERIQALRLVQQKLAAGDVDESEIAGAARIAHHLRGTAATFFADSLHGVAGETEATLKSDQAGPMQQHQALGTLIATCEAALKAA